MPALTAAPVSIARNYRAPLPTEMQLGSYVWQEADTAPVLDNLGKR